MKVLLPTPGTPLMPRRNALAGVRQQRVQQRVGARAVVGAGRLEQRDGLGQRAALRRAGRAAHGIEQRLVGVGQHQAPAPTDFLICSSTSLALAGIGVPGP